MVYILVLVCIYVSTIPDPRVGKLGTKIAVSTPSERHDWHGYIFHNLRKQQTAPRQIPGQFFAHFSFVCGRRGWPVRFGFMGLRMFCPHKLHKNHDLHM